MRDPRPSDYIDHPATGTLDQRLRQAASASWHRSSTAPFRALMLEAADEIERLRKASAPTTIHISEPPPKVVYVPLPTDRRQR